MTDRRRLWWLLAIALAVPAGLGIGAIIWASAFTVSPEVLPGWTQDDRDTCRRQVEITFSGDERDQRMRVTAEALRDDPNFDSVSQRTQQESFDHYKRIFAGQPELLELGRLESMPATITGIVREGTSANQVRDSLRVRLPEAAVDTQPYC